MEEAAAALEAENVRRQAETHEIIAQLLEDALSLTMESTASGKGDEAAARDLETSFHDRLRAIEADARHNVESLYNHKGVAFESDERLLQPIYGEDLFSEKTWTTLGLSPRQLLLVSAVTGGVAGGAVDVGVGGASFGTGALLGAGAGAILGAFRLYGRYARAETNLGAMGRLFKAVASSQTYRIGPLANPNFPFVLLDRALMHHGTVRDRPHARNAVEQTAKIEAQHRPTAQLSADQHRRFHRTFEKIRKAAKKNDGPPCRHATATPSGRCWPNSFGRSKRLKTLVRRTTVWPVRPRPLGFLQCSGPPGRNQPTMPQSKASGETPPVQRKHSLSRPLFEIYRP